jgi:hypothetical protein
MQGIQLDHFAPRGLSGSWKKSRVNFAMCNSPIDKDRGCLRTILHGLAKVILFQESVVERGGCLE